MGKIKSIILTSFIAAVLLVAAFFAFFSWNVPGSNGVKRYNSFITSIPLGGNLTGNAYTVIYPDGVISAEDYAFGLPDDAEKRAEYEGKYKPFYKAYVSLDALEEHTEEELKTLIEEDAKTLKTRLDKKHFSGCSVSVLDGCAIKISVPTNFTYAAYTQHNLSDRSAATSQIGQTIQAVASNGELSLRNTKVGKIYDSKLDNYILTPINADMTDYFKSFKKFVSAGKYAIKVNLTSAGKDLFGDITTSVSSNEDDKNIRFYIGESQLLALTCEESITEKSFYISTNSESVAEDYAIVLSSALEGKTLSLNYNAADSEIIYPTAPLGNYSAIYFFAALMALLLASIIFAVVRYKKLGLVFGCSAAIFTLTLIIALMTIGKQVTIAVGACCALGYFLFGASTFATFEAVRRQTEKGHTMQSAVKLAYKGLLSTMIDTHLVLLGVSVLVGLVGFGEISTCGLVLFISAIASYLLHWFTRFMWFVASSPAKDKFKFGGYKRRIIDDD